MKAGLTYPECDDEVDSCGDVDEDCSGLPLIGCEEVFRKLLHGRGVAGGVVQLVGTVAG